jgi:Na+-transporting NADH:ubiquinone oxidoreductase subunit B
MVMKGLRHFLDRQEKHFKKGGRLARLFPLFEATDTFLFTPGKVARNASFIRDVINVKRVMITVVAALLPCVFMALYNTGLQANIALGNLGADSAAGLRGAMLQALGVGINADNVFECMVHGALYFLPVYFVTLAVGGAWEGLFAVVRKSDISEGLLVTSLLFPLTLPAGIPLWQAALGISFGVVVGKEIFGGTGRNIFNPALTGRAFLFFAYPAQIT